MGVYVFLHPVEEWVVVCLVKGVFDVVVLGGFVEELGSV